MSIETLKNTLPDYARDTRINLGKVLEADGAELSAEQIQGVALASAYATKHPAVIAALEAETASLPDAVKEAAKAAATIMGMNNVYYRFVHLMGDKDYGKLPANLRMQVIGSPGIDKKDFELMSLAISAINGCGMCMEAHAQVVTQAGVTKTGVQHAVRIAAVLASTAQALTIADTTAGSVNAQAAA
jgi:lipoyl-dependent peroxiredoxin subunit D